MALDPRNSKTNPIILLFPDPYFFATQGDMSDKK